MHLEQQGAGAPGPTGANTVRESEGEEQQGGMPGIDRASKGAAVRALRWVRYRLERRVHGGGGAPAAAREYKAAG